MHTDLLKKYLCNYYHFKLAYPFSLEILLCSFFVLSNFEVNFYHFYLLNQIFLTSLTNLIVINLIHQQILLSIIISLLKILRGYLVNRSFQESLLNQNYLLKDHCCFHLSMHQLGLLFSQFLLFGKHLLILFLKNIISNQCLFWSLNYEYFSLHFL